MLFNIDRASLQLEGNLPFLLCFTLYLRAISTSTKPLGGLQSEGRFHSSFFVLRVCGGLYCLERLIRGGAWFRKFTVPQSPSVWAVWRYSFSPLRAYTFKDTPWMESIIREVNRRGTGHCTRWKPQSFKKVVKTGEVLDISWGSGWKSAEISFAEDFDVNHFEAFRFGERRLRKLIWTQWMGSGFSTVFLFYHDSLLRLRRKDSITSSSFYDKHRRLWQKKSRSWLSQRQFVM